MKLTTRSSYGVRALIDLAVMYGEKKPVSISNIAKEEGISNVFLEQIFNQLKNENIVKSVRGPKGGYVLTKDPSKITVYEVVKTLEGSIFSEKCIDTNGKDKKVCKRSRRCASKEVWDEVARQMKKTLEKFSLKDLADRAIKIDPHKLNSKVEEI